MDPYQPPGDRENPYAPPQSAFLARRTAWPATGASFTVGDVSDRTWSIFRARFWTCLSIVWGALGVNFGISVFTRVLLDGLVEITRDETMYRLLYILTLFVASVLQIWIAWIGQTIALLKIARGEPVAFEDVFKGGRFVLTVILATIVFIAVLAVPVLVAVGAITAGMVMMPELSLVATVLLFLAVSVPIGLVVVLLTVRLCMYYYMVIDRDAGVFESFRRSWRLHAKSGQHHHSGVLPSACDLARGVIGILRRTDFRDTDGEFAGPGHLSLSDRNGHDRRRAAGALPR